MAFILIVLLVVQLMTIDKLIDLKANGKRYIPRHRQKTSRYIEMEKVSAIYEQMVAGMIDMSYITLNGIRT